MLTAILFLLALAAVFYVAVLVRGALAQGALRPAWEPTAVGAVVNFFDTLGIGSFAPTTAIYKLRRIVPDELIPGTLNVGHTPSAIAEALIFVTAIVIDPLLLITVVGSAAAGAWLGAGVVAQTSFWVARNGSGTLVKPESEAASEAAT